MAYIGPPDKATDAELQEAYDHLMSLAEAAEADGRFGDALKLQDRAWEYREEQRRRSKGAA